MTIWRLLQDGAAPGAWNMAVDEALLLSYTASPTLRFYSWQPACVSLGRFQRLRTADCGLRIGDEPDAALSLNPQSAITNPQCFDLVRRPTGGRAVLHQHEITYAVVIGEQLLPAGARSVIGAYRWLSAGFIAGLRGLGVEARLARSDLAAPQRSTNCFASAAQCDFVVDDRKLIGAAQCRKHGVILQHGSLLIDMDEAAWKATVGGSMTDAVTLKSLGVTAGTGQIITALCAGVEGVLDVSLQAGTLNDAESALAHRLRCEKYSGRTWNQDGIPS